MCALWDRTAKAPKNIPRLQPTSVQACQILSCPSAQRGSALLFSEIQVAKAAMWSSDLQDINLAGNGIGAEGAEAIADVRGSSQAAGVPLSVQTFQENCPSSQFASG